MEGLHNTVVDSIERYFKILSRTGSSTKDNNLLVLIAIQDMMINFSEYITEEDIRTFMDVLYCISDNCMIDYFRLPTEDSLYREIKQVLELRITEDEKYRVTEGQLFRTKV